MLNLTNEFVLFRGNDDKAEGGVRDAVGSYDSIDAAIRAIGADAGPGQWAQVVSFRTGQRIYLEARNWRWHASVEDDGLSKRVAHILATEVDATGTVIKS